MYTSPSTRPPATHNTPDAANHASILRKPPLSGWEAPKAKDKSRDVGKGEHQPPLAEGLGYRHRHHQTRKHHGTQQQAYRKRVRVEPVGDQVVYCHAHHTTNNKKRVSNAPPTVGWSRRSRWESWVMAKT